MKAAEATKLATENLEKSATNLYNILLNEIKVKAGQSEFQLDKNYNSKVWELIKPKLDSGYKVEEAMNSANTVSVIISWYAA